MSNDWMYMYQTSAINYEVIGIKGGGILEILHMACDPTSKWNNHWPSFIDFIKKHMKTVQERNINISYAHESRQQFTIYCDQYPDDISMYDCQRVLKQWMSTVIAEYTVEILEKEIMLDLLEHDFGYRSAEEREKVYEYCWNVLFISDELHEAPYDSQIDEVKIVERKSRVYDLVCQYLEQPIPFQFDAFIRFKLKDFRKSLYETVQYAVDEYILEQEYQDFIRLVRYFISVQKSHLPLLHLVHVDRHQFHLVDNDGRRITERDVQSKLKEWVAQPVHHEELVVSTLITMAPKRVIVHTKDPSSSVIQTLQQIYQERLTICTGCELCRSYLLTHIDQAQYEDLLQLMKKK